MNNNYILPISELITVIQQASGMLILKKERAYFMKVYSNCYVKCPWKTCMQIFSLFFLFKKLNCIIIIFNKYEKVDIVK